MVEFRINTHRFHRWLAFGPGLKEADSGLSRALEFVLLVWCGMCVWILAYVCVRVNMHTETRSHCWWMSSSVTFYFIIYLFVYIYILNSVCMRVCVHGPGHMCGTTCRNQGSPTMWALRVTLGSPGLPLPTEPYFNCLPYFNFWNRLFHWALEVTVWLG